ncbi:hypothetical protein [Rhodococcus koreensis]
MTSPLARLFYAVPTRVYRWSSAVLAIATLVLWTIAIFQSPTTVKDWLSPIVAIVAVIVAALAMWQSSRSANAAQRNLKISELQEHRRRSGWAIETHPNEDRYVLRNAGTMTATDVNLDGDFHLLRFVNSSPGPVNIAPGEARSFDASTSIDHFGVEVEISWVTENETERDRWIEVLQPSLAGENARKEHSQEIAAARAWQKQRAVADRDEQLRLLLQLGDAYAAYIDDPTAPGAKLRVQLLVAALPPHLCREIGYEVDVARDVWGPNEYPFEKFVADTDRHLVEGMQAEIELMWNVRTVSDYAVHGPVEDRALETEPRIFWAVRGYVDRVNERQSGNRRFRLSPGDQLQRARTELWRKAGEDAFASERSALDKPSPIGDDGESTHSSPAN